MKNHSSRKSNKKSDASFRTPSLYKANKAQFGKQYLGHLKGNKSVQRSGYSVKG